MILILSVLSIGFSVNVSASLEGVVKIATMFCAYGIAYNSVKSLHDVDHIINSILIASIFPLFFGIYQAITGQYDQIYTGAIERINSVFGVGNAYGIFLTITICASIISLMRKGLSKIGRIVIIVLLCLMIVSQILALNRGTWIALCVAIFIAIIPYKKDINLRWFIIGAILIFSVFSGIIYDRFTNEGYRPTGEKRDTLSNRVEYWYSAVPMIMDRPIIGHGIGTTASKNDERSLLAPHNDYIRLALDIGILGSIVYIYFLVSLALYFLRKRNKINDVMFRYNFPMAVMNSYFVIISTTQNIVYNMVSFVIYMILNGAIIKLNVVEIRKKARVMYN
ncbi:MAG: O-antigen ligase family protein [Candidatus Thiodiazotropha sp. (ex Dulcina madagascariensis)]|nr:O-antigen ligase family protein [Candidatus Thiodiazotropha sp. (ex Dulcina madagascariensis)]